ncbi:MAG: hypothetical protein ACREBU_13975, partial [Nitrososphaera sp.]
MNTGYVTGWENFYDIVADLPGLYKEQYVKYGVRQFGISEKTAEKRLNDAIAETDSKLFEIQDPNDGRRRRLFVREPNNSPATISMGAPMALNEMATRILENCSMWSDWTDRLRDYARCRSIIQAAVLQLNERIAEAEGRRK